MAQSLPRSTPIDASGALLRWAHDVESLSSPRATALHTNVPVSRFSTVRTTHLGAFGDLHESPDDRVASLAVFDTLVTDVHTQFARAVVFACSRRANATHRAADEGAA